jgi:hypothetical protein
MAISDPFLLLWPMGWPDLSFVVNQFKSGFGSWRSLLNVNVYIQPNVNVIVLLSRTNLLDVMSRDSAVGMATGYGLDNRTTRLRFPVGAGNFSLRHHVQTGSGAHPASHPMGVGGSFTGGKRPGVKLTSHLHLVPSSKNAWSYTSTSQYVFMRWCLVKHRDNFTFTF